MIAFVLGHLLAAVQGEPTFAPVEVAASNGLFAAEIRKAAGQEAVRDPLARWRLAVYELPREAGAEPLWSCLHPHRPGERSYVLSDDGHAFALLEPEFSEARPLVRVWRDAEPLADLSHAELSIDRRRLERDAPKAWLAVGAAAPHTTWLETERGPVQFLELQTSYGEPRLVDLETAQVWTSRTIVEPIAIAPAASRQMLPGLRAATVTRVATAPVAYRGEPLAVLVNGAFPTPNWVLAGFELALGGEDGRELVLTPLCAPPTRDTVQLQVLERFEYTARITGLPPGAYRVRCAGAVADAAEPIAVEVRPARSFVELRRTGGVAGLDQTISVYGSGVAVERWARPVREPAQRFAVLRLEARKRIAELAGLALAQPAPHAGVAVVDAFALRLTVFDGQRARETSCDEPALDGARRKLADELLALFK